MIHKRTRKGHYLVCLLGLPLLLALFSCGSTFMHVGRNEIKDIKKLPQYWLTTTMYAGQFYDDDKLVLVDYRPFSALNDAETLDGYTFYPPNPTLTIPAGTLIKIIGVSYPDDKTIINRPIYSPRNNIWVYLRVAKERGMVSIFKEKTHVMVIPQNIINEKQLKGYLSRFLSNKDPNRWILQRESHIQDGIFNKRPIIGMMKEDLLAALGPANKKQFQKKNDFQDAQEVWHYHNYYIVFYDDAVAKIKKLDTSQSKPSLKKI